MNRHISDEVLSAYLDGEIDTSREPQLEAHLASCTDCKARFTAMRGVVLEIRRAPRLAPPPMLGQRVREEVTAQGGAGALERVWAALSGWPFHPGMRTVMAMTFALAVGLSLVSIEREHREDLLTAPIPVEVEEQLPREWVEVLPSDEVPVGKDNAKTTTKVAGRVFVLTADGSWVQQGLEGREPEARMDARSPQGQAMLTRLTDLGLLLTDGSRVVLRYNWETVELSAPAGDISAVRPARGASLVWFSARA
ncbi:MAG TPA: zf-HC2 domain-containing protein [Thermoanaerobaculia bacterium]|nr:zf-HC2 domain-containing protein [Thermoanaerobaculia bacterium]